MNKMTGSKLTKTSPYKYSIYGLLMSLFIVAGIQNATADALAIEGYDPVAYFEMHKPVKGSEAITHAWLGKQWLFTSNKHRNLFVEDPMTYMPNYGGYCSYDPVSAGHDHKIDPTAWRIVENELYLFYSERDANHAMPTEAWDKVKAGLSQ
jgi:YHS domain-containing protein